MSKYMKAPVDGNCGLDGCEVEYYAKGLCEKHYAKMRKYGNPETSKPLGRKIQQTICKIDGCEEKHISLGFCRNHYLESKIGKPASPNSNRMPIRKSHGYVEVYKPEHPKARGTGYISEHRIVMEEYLGRYLEPWEQVHHKNAIRHDNRIENLELWSKSQPTGARVVDLVDYAFWILENYLPDMEKLDGGN